MNSINDRLLQLGLRVPDLMLPAPGINLEKWAVIACDQFTSRREYWNEIDAFVGGDPSTLRLILPEAYLKDADADVRISDIHSTAVRYLQDKVLIEKPSTCMFVERTTPSSQKRTGLIIAVDLEKYDYTPGSKSLIRATEGTILDRIPPREKIRLASPMEFPHIMVLFNDPENQVFASIRNETCTLQPSYSFNLMAGGGQIKGYPLHMDRFGKTIADSFERLFSSITEKSANDRSPLLFAIGDGNHSLAAAKAVWERIKVATGDYLHSSRFALVELVNVYDEGLVFHPIHRVMFNVDPEAVVRFLRTIHGIEIRMNGEKDRMIRHIESSTGISGGDDSAQEIGLSFGSSFGLIQIRNSRHFTATGSLQEVLDMYCRENPSAVLDYIHGTAEVIELSGRKGGIGFYLPVMKKEYLFPTIEREGILPRKAFSLGVAEEKRYYLEGRRIRD